MMPNFNALAMEPMAHVAGTASSVGLLLDGSGRDPGHADWALLRGWRPAARASASTLLFIATLGVVLVTERFKLMQAKTAVSPHLVEQEENAADRP